MSAYTSWPVLIEGPPYTPPPYILWKASDVWPFPTGGFASHNVPTSVLFYIWWLDLAVVAFVRVPRRFWWRVAVCILAIPAFVVGDSYAAACSYDWINQVTRAISSWL